MKRNKRIRISPSIQICLGFALLILLGTFLLCLPMANKDGKWLNIIDSLLTSVGSVCITGLSVFSVASQFTLFGQIVVLLLIQIGGLGIICLTSLIFLILGKKFNLTNRMALQEGLNKDNIQGVVKFVKKILIIALAIELVGTLLLLYSTIAYYHNFWQGLYCAIFLSISAFCNAGVDIFADSASLGSFSSNILMLLPIMMLIILGGVGFVVLTDGFKNRKAKQHTNCVLIITAILIVVGMLLYMLLEWNNPRTIGNMSTGDKVLNSLFQSISSRTAGFSTIDQSLMTSGSKYLTMILMCIGGAPNSTAGGIKITTLLITLLFVFKKSNDNGDIAFFNRKISNKVIRKALKIVIVFFATLFVGIFAIRLAEPESVALIDIVFESISALSTTGFTVGLTATASNVTKIILIALMYIGRIGMSTMILSTSSNNTIHNNIEYNNTDIIVG